MTLNRSCGDLRLVVLRSRRSVALGIYASAAIAVSTLMLGARWGLGWKVCGPAAVCLVLVAVGFIVRFVGGSLTRPSLLLS